MIKALKNLWELYRIGLYKNKREEFKIFAGLDEDWDMLRDINGGTVWRQNKPPYGSFSIDINNNFTQLPSWYKEPERGENK